MKKKLGLMLASAIVLNTLSIASFAWTSPLKKYNLYNDVTSGGNIQVNDDRERAMGDYYNNSLGKNLYGGDLKYSENENPNNIGKLDYSDSDIPENFKTKSLQNFVPTPQYTAGRNETLRQSSRNVYSDPVEPNAWEQGPSFYPNPSLDSIIEKYRRSDFAGCLQESSAYVRQHPTDTLGYYYLAMSYTKVNDKDNAVKAYERVIALNDNPMIVKYATNGRNCIMENKDEACFENVNEPEYLHPYAYIADMDLTPINPQVLIDRNLARLKYRLSPDDGTGETSDSANNSNDKDKVVLPFGKQDSELDAFINAPYGNGLSPELNAQYKQLQLKKLQETINKEEQAKNKNYNNMNDIKKFDRQKSDSETIKLAYDPSAIDMNSIVNDPQYMKQKQELDELNMLLGNDKSSESDMMDLIPYMTEKNKNLSPEVIQTLMMKSMMGSITL